MMLSSNDAAAAQAATAIRSLNVDFVRKGIVVSGADGERQLDPKIRRLVESLKGSCKAAGTRELGDVMSAIQLWKERSLHHTLQTLVQARLGTQDSTTLEQSRERQIQAIELHEKAGREVKDAVLRVLQNVSDAVLRHIDNFTAELEAAIRALLKPELEEELERERAKTERLIAEKQRFLKDHVALQDAHATLTKRLDAWETAEDGGGDAVLCRKLRDQVKQLKQTQRETETKLLAIEKQNDQWRYEMVAIKAELETVHQTLAMTRAMHDKETKQLVELVHNREEQFDRVRQATSVGKSTAPPPITSYDAHSGRTICFPSPTKTPASPSKTTRTVLTCLAPQQPRGVSLTEASVPASPNKKRTVASARPTVRANRQDDALSGHVSPRATRRFSSPAQSRMNNE